jgi:hypothetical protein
MSLRLIQLPRPVPAGDYEAAIVRMAATLSRLDGVVSVSQVGGTGTPGISDIDLFVVFEDGVACNSNPVAALHGVDRYLFSHNLFGTSRSLASAMEQYTFFGHYKTLSGRPVTSVVTATPAETEWLKKQVAMEYLLKAWLTVNTETAYGIIKVRNLFLYSKALLLDLDFLDGRAGPLADAVSQLVAVRNRWFEAPVSAVELTAMVRTYAQALEEFLRKSLNGHPFYIPDTGNLPVTRNTVLRPGHPLQLRHAGMRLPSWLSSVHPRFVNLQHRFIRWTLDVPSTALPPAPVLKKRHDWIAGAVDYNKKNLPGFVPTAYGMNIFNHSSA